MTDENDIVELLRSVPPLDMADEWNARLHARMMELNDPIDATHDAPGGEIVLSVTTARRKRFHCRQILVYVAASIAFCVIACGVTAIGVARYLRTVEELESAPAKVVVSKSGQYAYLVARNQKVLHAWAASPRGIGSGVFIPAEQSGGQGALAVLGYEARDEHHPAMFAAYAVNSRGGIPDQDEPIWTVGVSDNEIPADLRVRADREYHGNQFSGRVCKIADVFPAHSGDEVIAVFQHGPFSQCVVRVYGLDGKVLYSAWHDGNVADAYWMAATGQICCAAVNAEVTAAERGFPEANRMHPVVLFALAPKLGFAEPKWIDTVDHQRGIKPAWYRCVLNLPDSTSETLIRLDVPAPGLGSASNLSVTFDIPTMLGTATLSFSVDASGKIVPKSWTTSSVYDQLMRQGELPEPTTVQLGDLPPIKNRDGVWIPGVTTLPSTQPNGSS